MGFSSTCGKLNRTEDAVATYLGREKQEAEMQEARLELLHTHTHLHSHTHARTHTHQSSEKQEAEMQEEALHKEGRYARCNCMYTYTYVNLY